MSLYVEGSSLLKQLTGVGQFTKRLLEAYVKNYPEEKVNIFGFKFFTRGEPEYSIKASKNVRYKIIRLMPGRVYNQLYKYGAALPIDTLFGAKKTDVFLFPNFVRFPLLRNKRAIVMVHDLSYVYFSQYTHPKDLPYKMKYVPPSVKKAQHIITISSSSKRQVMDYYHVPAKKISIVSPAVDTDHFYKRSAAEISRIKKKYKLPKNYLLYAGTVEPRKNIKGLLEAYEQAGAKIQKDYGLVLAGGKGWQDEGILQRIAELQQKGLNVILTGYIPDKDLPAIHSGATIFIFPSFYEGFGIPPLEAMACGVPVISADNSSLPEAVGEAGILINADKPSEITRAIKKLLASKTLRDSYVKKGLKQVKLFTWDNAAKQLHDAIKTLG